MAMRAAAAMESRGRSTRRVAHDQSLKSKPFQTRMPTMPEDSLGQLGSRRIADVQEGGFAELS